MEVTILVVSCLVFFILGFSSGWKGREFHAKALLNHIIKEQEAKDEKPESNVIHVLVEKHHDIFYAFERKTDKFLGQAATKEELDEVLTKRYPGKRFGVTPENMNDVGWV